MITHPEAPDPDLFEQARRARRAEWAIVASFGVSMACALGVVAVYYTGGQVQLEGVLLGGMAGGIGVGLVLWSKNFMPHRVVVEEREDLPSSEEEIRALQHVYTEGRREIGRRKLLVGTGAGAILTMIVALLPPIRSLGPKPEGLRHTPFRTEPRLVDESNKPITPGDINVNGVVSAFPEDDTDTGNAIVLLIRPDKPVHPEPGREGWTVNNIIGYSKLCTHVGCPVGLYQAEEHLLLCPCHQSTFKVLDGGEPIFGPAANPLPQLPLQVGADGYLRSAGDFSAPPGPGFWDRDK